MKRLIGAALVAGMAMVGAAAAQERTTASTVTRQSESVRVVESRDGPVLRRCSGVACLQSIPSLGVAF